MNEFHCLLLLMPQTSRPVSDLTPKLTRDAARSKPPAAHSRTPGSGVGCSALLGGRHNADGKPEAKPKSP